MRRLQGGLRGPDSARTALIVGGIGIVLGGAALFGIVAHTRTPWSTQRVVGLVPLDSLSRVDLVVPMQSTQSKGESPKAIPASPPPPLQVVAPTAHASPAPPDSLSQGESVVILPKPVEPIVVAKASLIEPKAVDSTMTAAELKVLGAARWPDATVPKPGAVGPASVVTRVADAASVEPRHVEPKHVEPKPAPPRTIEVNRVEPKAAPSRQAETKRVESKPAKVVEAKRIEPKPLVPKATVAKRFESKAVGFKVAGAKRTEPKPSSPKIVQPKTYKLTPVSLKVEAKPFEPKAAPSWIAEAKLAQARREELERADEQKAAEEKLAETKRAVETTLAQAKQAQAKLDETRRAVEVTLAEARPVARPAVETRTLCETCGTVTSVSTRGLDQRTSIVEVHVHFATGNNWTFRYQDDPGFSSGDRVRVQSGHLLHM